MIITWIVSGLFCILHWEMGSESQPQSARWSVVDGRGLAQSLSCITVVSSYIDVYNFCGGHANLYDDSVELRNITAANPGTLANISRKGGFHT